MRIFGNVARISAGAALLLLAGVTATAQAAPVFSDSFNTNGALLGSTPGVGANWAITGASVVNPLTVNSNVLSIANTGQDAFSAFGASVPATAGTKLFTGFTMNVTAANATGDYFVHLSDPAGTTGNFYQRIFARSSGAGFQLGLASFSGTGSVTTYGTPVLNFGQNYRVVSSWEFVSGTANDIMNLYVDPVNSVDTSNVAYVAGYTWTGSAEPAQVSAVNIRQGTAASAATLTVDDLIVSTAFADVLVPEPGSLALLGLAALPGFALLRRRKLAK